MVSKAKRRVKKVDAQENISGQELIKSRLGQINDVISRLEKEFEGLFKRFIKQGERSSIELKRNFDDILKKLKKTDFYLRAQEKREDLEREIRRLSDDIVEKVRSFELGHSRFSGKKILKDVRKNLDSFVDKIERTDFFSKAKNRAENTKDGILTFLSIPSQNEVERLEKKITNLEKRLHNLSDKAA